MPLANNKKLAGYAFSAVFAQYAARSSLKLRNSPLSSLPPGGCATSQENS
jgi:hypothetical protein